MAAAPAPAVLLIGTGTAAERAWTDGVLAAGGGRVAFVASADADVAAACVVVDVAAGGDLGGLVARVQQAAAAPGARLAACVVGAPGAFSATKARFEVWDALVRMGDALGDVLPLADPRHLYCFDGTAQDPAEARRLLAFCVGGEEPPADAAAAPPPPPELFPRLPCEQAGRRWEAFPRLAALGGGVAGWRRGNGDTALIAAARYGLPALCWGLLKRSDVDVNACNSSCGTALLWAAAARLEALALAMVASHRAHVNATNHAGETPLHHAARHGLGRLVASLIASGADVNAKSLPVVLTASPGARARSATTALILAASAGAAGVCQLLLDSGADVNVSDYSGCTAIMAAARAGMPDICARLIALGADPAARDHAGESARSLAAAAGGELARVLAGDARRAALCAGGEARSRLRSGAACRC